MKVLISTINDNNNYGNRLQNYALQQVLKQFAADVITLDNRCNEDSNDSLFQKLSYAVKKGEITAKVLKKIGNRDEKKIKKSKAYFESFELRKKNFESFTKNLVPATNFFINGTTEDFSFVSDFDYVVIGSDQVWNYNFRKNLPLDFAPYATKEKVISYAASFGVSSIPENFKKIYEDGLNNIGSISVREEVGLEIINEIVGKDALVVLDPTMLLSKDEWLKISSNEVHDTDYVLTYFLGTPSQDEYDYIRKYAESRELKIKQLGTIYDLANFSAGPKEFVELFSKAKAIFTDSYHACVFSIIFEKYFEVFDRKDKNESMNSRIETLLSTFDLEFVKYTGYQKSEIDYSQVNSTLKADKEKSMEFIKESLSK